MILDSLNAPSGGRVPVECAVALVYRVRASLIEKDGSAPHDPRIIGLVRHD
jgi:hypothetical protein